MDLKNIRDDKETETLIGSESYIDLSADPLIVFQEWLDFAISKSILQPNAMTLSTRALDGSVNSRVVLMKEFDQNEGQLSFFSSYDSLKAKELDRDDRVSLNFFWFELGRQIRIKARTFKSSREYSEEYFDSRPKESRAAAICSDQSQRVRSRKVLLERYDKAMNGKLECPISWGGYWCEILEIEFWTGFSNRLHDRIYFEKKGNNVWNSFRLCP